MKRFDLVSAANLMWLGNLSNRTQRSYFRTVRREFARVLGPSIGWVRRPAPNDEMCLYGSQIRPRLRAYAIFLPISASGMSDLALVPERLDFAILLQTCLLYRRTTPSRMLNPPPQ